ncbi:hypothetical protein CCP3SC5AM1_760013 [Gammaproteobacteria bacterium]
MDNDMIIAIAAGSVVLIGFGWWFFGSSSENGTPKSREDITKLVENLGYKVKEIDFDDGVYEVEAYQNGKEFEIKLDRMGKILEVKQDD